MKVSYKDHEITAYREESMAGYEMMYWSIFRETDWFECASGFEDSAETVPDMIGYLKERVDAELQEEDPWGENAWHS